MSPNWWNQAACQGQPVDLFFPGSGEKQKMAKAKAFCRSCSVTVECLGDALKAEDPTARYGVYGGMSSTERKLMFGGHVEVPAPELSA